MSSISLTLSDLGGTGSDPKAAASAVISVADFDLRYVIPMRLQASPLSYPERSDPLKSLVYVLHHLRSCRQAVWCGMSKR